MTSNNTLFMSLEESNHVCKTVQDRTKRCQELKGQPRELSDPKALIEQAVSTSLMQDLSSAAFGLGTSKSKETMVAYGVGSPYPPCMTRLEDLKPMKLTDLLMETHHRDYALSLRRVSPVAVLEASSWAVVQGDSPDEVERIEIFLHRSQCGHDILDLASEFVVKEPYHTLNNQGEPTIRIDHPSDLVISTISENPESWRQKELPHTQTETVSAEEYKKRGNTALLKKKDLARAHFYYTKGLNLLSDGELNETLRNDLHRNRSHVNLQLQKFDEARSDALSSITNGQSDELKSLDAKAYNRAGLAAYAQGEFMDARQFFGQQKNLQPGDQYPALYIRKVDARLREETDGTYNMSRIVSTLSKTQGRPDAATFDGPMEVKESLGAGRGLFATRDLEPNEMILCEKAFCVAWGYEPETFSALVCDTREDAAIKVFPAGLHKKVVQKLLNNPSQVEKLLGLHGVYGGLGDKLQEVDGVPIIDTFQIHDIIQRNGFGPGQQTEDEDVSNASTGIWIRASYMNHSCVSNSKKDFVGDLIVIRATRRIKAGEEITHSYDESSDYEARKVALQRTWGFECRCSLCEVEKTESAEVRKRRHETEEKARHFAETTNPSGASRIAVRKAKMLRQALNETYDEKRWKGLPRRARSVIDEWLRMASAS
ncbi:hypothetical protein FSARC_1326 [Fusarium sarcochroum]|uniref:SET domain-containing protein n=1 Tax=Fusarium sarcochroum TaxID=1208366 RepID=A0A8H4U941_9HYPO|nr:hypothetical protein FSARC_1326 [Fusarium sarcochroum]